MIESQPPTLLPRRSSIRAPHERISAALLLVRQVFADMEHDGASPERKQPKCHVSSLPTIAPSGRFVFSLKKKSAEADGHRCRSKSFRPSPTDQGSAKSKAVSMKNRHRCSPGPGAVDLAIQIALVVLHRVGSVVGQAEPEVFRRDKFETRGGRGEDRLGLSLPKEDPFPVHLRGLELPFGLSNGLLPAIEVSSDENAAFLRLIYAGPVLEPSEQSQISSAPPLEGNSRRIAPR